MQAMDIDIDNNLQSQSQNTQLSFDAQTIKKLHPKEYCRRFILQNVRPDGRSLSKFRKVQLTIDSIQSAEGSAMVKLGQTSVLCGIKAEVSTPPVNSPNMGYFVPNIELPPLCSSKFRPGAPSEQTQALSEELDQLLTKSNVVNLESLCIEEGLASWVIYADIYCLNYDGNVYDACLLALIAALKSARLPTATFYEDECAVRAGKEKTTQIKLNRVPIPATFSIFDRETLLADPTDFEESLATSAITVVLDESSNLLSITKYGGNKVPRTTLKECIALAKRRYDEVKRKLVDNGLW